MDNITKRNADAARRSHAAIGWAISLVCCITLVVAAVAMANDTSSKLVGCRMVYRTLGSIHLAALHNKALIPAKIRDRIIDMTTGMAKELPNSCPKGYDKPFIDKKDKEAVSDLIESLGNSLGN